MTSSSSLIIYILLSVPWHIRSFWGWLVCRQRCNNNIRALSIKDLLLTPEKEGIESGHAWKTQKNNMGLQKLHNWLLSLASSSLSSSSWSSNSFQATIISPNVMQSWGQDRVGPHTRMWSIWVRINTITVGTHGEVACEFSARSAYPQDFAEPPKFWPHSTGGRKMEVVQSSWN